jgi:hypothetical protein
MTDIIQPRSVKRNQHYVPRFWLARFAGVNGRLVGLKDGILQHQVGLDDIMSDDWIYTVFDSLWQSSDEIEDDLSVIEGEADQLFTNLHSGRDSPSNAQWEHLCSFLALTACRHVDTMTDGHDRAKEMGLLIADAASYGNDIPRKTAIGVFNVLESVMLGSVHPRGVGEFTLPGLCKITQRKVPARKAGTLIRNPATGEMMKGAAKARYCFRLFANRLGLSSGLWGRGAHRRQHSPRTQFIPHELRFDPFGSSSSAAS